MKSNTISDCRLTIVDLKAAQVAISGFSEDIPKSAIINRQSEMLLHLRKKH